MKKFEFRLERVLQYRKVIKDEKMSELLNSNREFSMAETKLKDLQMAMLLNQLEANTQTSAEHLQQIAAYGSRLANSIVDQKEAVEEAQKKVEIARARYVEAAQEEESLEKLKGKKFLEYKKYVEDEDGKFLDELTVQRAGFKKKKDNEHE